MIPTSQEMTARVKAAFTGGVARPGVSPGYRLGMLLVLLGLVMLPLIYLALIAGSCWLVVWHFQHDHVWIARATGFDGRHNGRVTLMVTMAYVGVGLAGIIFVLFLIKPLFAPPAKEPPPVTLDPISQPALFALIQQICAAIGAPMPVEVQVDCRVNASASFRRGLASFFSNDLVLTIGMPLVAGLTVRQLAAVLAHEFGHFAQGGAMRLDYLLRSINHWFCHVVQERDGWDERLERLAAGESWLSFVIGHSSRGMLWIGRGVLGCLMKAGGAMSGFMSRQMEFDADAHAARVTGSQEIVGALMRLRALDHAEGVMAEEMLQWLKDHGNLPDNIPLRVQAHERDMPDHLRQKLVKNALAADTEWWHTHPCLRERRDKLATLKAPGIFHLDAPGTHLFADFKGLCQTVSAYWYEVELGLDLNHVDLINVDQHEEATDHRKACDAAIADIFGTEPSSYRLLPFPADLPDHATQVALVDSWKSGYHAAFLEEDRLRKIAMHQICGCRLADIGFPLHMLTERHIDCRSREAAEASMNAGVQAYQTYSTNMQVFENAAWGRVGAALALHYRDPGTSDAWRQQVTRLVEAQRALAAATRHYLGGWMDSMTLCAALKDEASHPAGSHALHTHLRGWDQRLHAELTGMVQALSKAQDPFSPEPQPLSACIPPPQLQEGESYYAWGAFDRMRWAQHEPIDRVTGELCLLAREVERGWERQTNSVMPTMNAAPQPRSSMQAHAGGWQPVMA